MIERGGKRRHESTEVPWQDPLVGLVFLFGTEGGLRILLLRTCRLENFLAYTNLYAVTPTNRTRLALLVQMKERWIQWQLMDLVDT